MSKKIDIDKLSETQMTSKDLEELKERISEIQKQKIIDDLLKMKNQFVEYCEENNLDLTDAFELVGFTKGGMRKGTGNSSNIKTVATAPSMAVTVILWVFCF